LRQDDREPNRAGAIALGLELASSKIVKDSSFVLLVGLEKSVCEDWIKACEGARVPFGLIHPFLVSKNASCAMPMPSHWERDGHYINHLGIVQYSDFNLETEDFSLLQILYSIKGSKPLEATSIFDANIAPLLIKDEA